MSLRRDLALFLSPDLRTIADQMQAALTHIAAAEDALDQTTHSAPTVEGHLFAARTALMFSHLNLTGRMPQDTPWSPTADG